MSIRERIGRWLYVQKCDCCRKDVDMRIEPHYHGVLGGMLCNTCIMSCSRDDGRWSHLSRLKSR